MADVSAGLMFGVAIGFSMKSMILGAALLIATLAVRSGGGETGSNVQRCLRLGLPFLAGSLLIPGALFFWFMSRHALSNVAYCVFTFNDRYPVRLSRRILGLGMLALSSWLYIRLAAVVAGSTLVDALRRKRMFVFSAALQLRGARRGAVANRQLARYDAFLSPDRTVFRGVDCWIRDDRRCCSSGVVEAGHGRNLGGGARRHRDREPWQALAR